MSRNPLVPLGDFLTLARDEVEVEADKTYRTAGIYSFGRGLFTRPAFLGSETRYGRLFRLREGRFVFSRLNAWEGALAVVPREFEGLFVSAEYPTFDVDPSRAERGYLGWLCRWPRLWDELTPRGSMVRRKRSHPEQALAVTVPLPAPAEQRRIAAWLDSLEATAASARRLGEKANAIGQAGWLSALSTTFTALARAHGTVPIGDVAEINPESVDPSAEFRDGSFAYIDIASVEKTTGRVGPVATVRGDEAPSRARRRVRAGDILVSTVRPNLRGFAIVPPELDGQVCSTGFAVLRHRDGVVPEFLLYQVLSDTFLAQLTTSARGGHYPAVNDQALRSAQVVKPRPSEQHTIAEHLARLHTRFRQIAGLAESQVDSLSVLVPAALQRALTA